jgi:hypothetical protein
MTFMMWFATTGAVATFRCIGRSTTVLRLCTPKPARLAAMRAKVEARHRFGARVGKACLVAQSRRQAAQEEGAFTTVLA